MITPYTIYQNPYILLYTLLPLVIWELVWKGFGLWKAANNDHKWWFFFILILNTAGLLPIIYLIFFRKKE